MYVSIARLSNEYIVLYVCTSSSLCLYEKIHLDLNTPVDSDKPVLD